MRTRRSLMLATAFAPAAFAAPAPKAIAHAASGDAALRDPLPGVRRLVVGEAVVTALLDGSTDLPLSLFPQVSEAVAAPVLDLQFAHFPVRIAVNAFLVQAAGRTVLIDTGSATALGPTLGRLPLALATAGIDPAGIDVVAMTHLHPDHVNGLLAPGGQAAFPNAELVLHSAEHRFWTDDGARSRAPAAMRPYFDAAHGGIAPYTRRTRLLSHADEVVVPGMTAVPLPGHTPGHTGYRISDSGRELLVWGDIVHAPALQFTRPDWGIAFDVDIDSAARTRARVFEVAAIDRTLVAGMHLDFPAFGHVLPATEPASYRFVPLPWQGTL